MSSNNSGSGGVIDLLRSYTAPRGLLVAILFVLAVLTRIPSVILAVFVHLLERSSDRLMAWINAVPPQPTRRARTTGKENPR